MIRHAIALLATTTGCATMWATSQATGIQRMWDETIREQTVPQPGVTEQLVVSMPLAIEYEVVPAATPHEPPKPGAAKPFALTCTVSQHGRDATYHSAFRYGSTWKTGTAISFLVEGLVSAGFLFLGDRSPSNVFYGGLVGIDAVVAGALFFVPRKEIYRRDDQEVTTPIRSDCPDGLTLELAGTSLPIDAAGHLGELGEAALDEWMAAPTGEAQVGLPGRMTRLPLDDAERCAWLRAHRPAQPQCRGTLAAWPRVTTATIAVSPGTLTRIAGD